MKTPLYPQASSLRTSSPAHRSSGFSLIEILSIVAIIGILAALLVPSLRGAIESSQQSKCLANLRQLASGCLLYAQDNEGALPFATGSGSWHRLIYPYLLARDEDSATWDDEQWKAHLRVEKIYQCPADKSPYEGFLSYGWNSNLKGIAAKTAYRLGRGKTFIMLAEGTSYNLKVASLSFRHRDRANFAFTDGHVETYAKSEPMESRLSVEL